MAAVYRFRITFEEFDDVYREIEIKANQTFFDLHNAIQVAINFDNTKDASFFISNDNWARGHEIPLNNRGNDKLKTMDRSKIAAHIDDPHQKILYLFDPEKEWVFFIELIKIADENAKIEYPKCVKQIGMAPKQYKTNNVPPPDDDTEEEEAPEDKKEKIFATEEGYDESDSDEDMIEDGEEESKEGEEGEESEETADAEGDSEDY